MVCGVANALMKRGEPIIYEEESNLKQEEVKTTTKSEKKNKKYVSRFALSGDNTQIITSKNKRR